MRRGSWASSPWHAGPIGASTLQNPPWIRLVLQRPGIEPTAMGSRVCRDAGQGTQRGHRASLLHLMAVEGSGTLPQRGHRASLLHLTATEAAVPSLAHHPLSFSFILNHGEAPEEKLHQTQQPQPSGSGARRAPSSTPASLCGTAAARCLPRTPLVPFVTLLLLQGFFQGSLAVPGTGASAPSPSIEHPSHCRHT